ncbi:MAG: DUF72 domain-containing protein [Verrucomicrobia bacterium]|nr:MAG: DUF72 domain-containing protein [Verrucomicrobiota bacterium]
MSFDRARMKETAAALAGEGIYIGGSSWKYSGWLGQLYTQDRYVWKGRFAEARFERQCLAEYAEVFKSVCVDAAYYKFPDQRFLDQLFPEVPPDFQFAFKVTDQITIKYFPNLPRFGMRAGTENRDFLNAERFEAEFLGPCKPFRQQVGLLIFEFSRFSAKDFERGRDFVQLLDEFLGRLPRGWRYGVEIRNRNFLRPEYFAMLSRHGVAHIFNSWQDMPPLLEQMALSGSRTAPEFTGARLLLKPGRKYEEAVKMFSPYNEIKELYPEGRAAGAKLIEETRQQGGGAKTFIYVNNRFEGNSLETMAGILDAVERVGAESKPKS